MTVILVGALVLSPALQDSAEPNTPLIVGSAYDVIALAVATGLGVFKPGHAWRSQSRGMQ